MPITPLTRVRPLLTGARVALVAPAGGLRGEEDLDRARANVESLGWEPVLGRHALEAHAYFAGTDAQRLADLNEAIRDANVDAVWCVRGGYGSMRLLDDIDYAALRANPKPVIGFSDVCALHSAIHRRCGIVTYHGPVARMQLTGFTRESLITAVTSTRDSAGAAPGARTIRGGVAEGVLFGGNLAVIAALTGTRYAPELRDAILVLEDINERTYRVDRMLRQLHLAGVLDGCRAIVFGECTDCGHGAESGARSLDAVLAEIAELLDVPCVAGVPLGHIDDQWTLPLGEAASLDADALALNVTRQES